MYSKNLKILPIFLLGILLKSIFYKTEKYLLKTKYIFQNSYWKQKILYLKN